MTPRDCAYPWSCCFPKTQIRQIYKQILGDWSVPTVRYLEDSLPLDKLTCRDSTEVTG